jgi:threonine dehydratase
MISGNKENRRDGVVSGEASTNVAITEYMMDAPVPSNCVTFGDIRDAALRLSGVVHKTPVHTSSTCDAMVGCEVFFKCENFQRMGAFKIRGAYNAISRLPENVTGIVAGSSGSHAQAAALAARMLGKKAVIVMPSDALEIKLRATRGYGGEIVFFDREKERREDVVNRLCAELGYPEIPAHNHPHIIAGQGTVALEFHEQAPCLTHLVIPVSGGGLMGGCAVAAKTLAPGCQVYGVEPETGDDFYRSLASGVITRIQTPKTIAPSRIIAKRINTARR